LDQPVGPPLTVAVRYPISVDASAVADVRPFNTGELIVGPVPNTAEPLPVSSLSTPASCADVVAANCERSPPVAAAPRAVRAAAAVAPPVPPCAIDRAVVRPESDVMSLFAPLFAADRLPRAVVAFATSERLLAFTSAFASVAAAFAALVDA